MNHQLPCSRVPAIRIRDCNSASINTHAEYVLYWMIAYRRTEWNFSLQRAVEWAVHLHKPLVIFEPLRIGYRWASDRIHRFVIDGMADNAARIVALQPRGVLYFPYVERQRDEGKGLLAALAERACVVVTDDFPSFFLPRMVSAAASRMPVKLEQIDGNGLLPLRSTDRVFTSAFSFRALLQKELLHHVVDMPQPEPLADRHLPLITALPETIAKRWPPLAPASLDDDRAKRTAIIADLSIDHSVPAVEQRGGSTAARAMLRSFLERHVDHYHEDSNHPDKDVRSGLSPYLHFGHISPHELFHELMARERWTPERIGSRASGKREGWWHVRAGPEAWLDQFITWRELGYNFASHRDDYDQYGSLPDWARNTLERHAWDRRQHLYSVDEFAAAATHDPIWNAAQRQLLREGRIHNYLRMLWGKKFLEWTASPRDALEAMIEINNRFALDGRNPNSYSGIFWCLGRYDRAWGPERPIFGKVRYMSSENTARKFRIGEYLRRYGND